LSGELLSALLFWELDIPRFQRPEPIPEFQDSKIPAPVADSKIPDFRASGNLELES